MKHVSLTDDFRGYMVNERADRWNYYHLSSKDLGETFTFTPRIPNDPYMDDDENPIEDIVTKRTSWARSLRKCWQALGNEEGVAYYVYATDNLGSGHVDVCAEFGKCRDGLGQYGQRYDIRWNMQDYIDSIRKNHGETLTKKQVMYGDLFRCVPDADETGEQWATTPVTAKRIGTFKNGRFYENLPEAIVLRKFVKQVLNEGTLNDKALYNALKKYANVELAEKASKISNSVVKAISDRLIAEPKGRFVAYSGKFPLYRGLSLPMLAFKKFFKGKEPTIVNQYGKDVLIFKDCLISTYKGQIASSWSSSPVIASEYAAGNGSDVFDGYQVVLETTVERNPGTKFLDVVETLKSDAGHAEAEVLALGPVVCDAKCYRSKYG